MFKSVLIANRGEIACRIARTAKRLGLRTIAVYSEADAGALHVRLADEAHAIGAAAGRRKLSAHRQTDRGRPKRRAPTASIPATAFCRRTPISRKPASTPASSSSARRRPRSAPWGLKDSAKALMEKAGVPVVPGYHGDMQEAKFLKEKAYEIGYPVLIKAVAGGGGKGMRRVDRHADFETSAGRRPARGESRLRRRARADREIRHAHATSRCRSSPTATATPSISTNATVRCSAVTESDRGGAGAGHGRRTCAPRWARPPSPPPRPPVTKAPAPSNSSPTARPGSKAARSGSWR